PQDAVVRRATHRRGQRVPRRHGYLSAPSSSSGHPTCRSRSTSSLPGPTSLSARFPWSLGCGAGQLRAFRGPGAGGVGEEGLAGEERRGARSLDLGELGEEGAALLLVALEGNGGRAAGAGGGGDAECQSGGGEEQAGEQERRPPAYRDATRDGPEG